MAKLKLWIHNWLIALDRLAFVTLFGPPALILGREIPSPNETISSYVGRHALIEEDWALVLQSLIDHLFMLLGSAPGHCYRSIEDEKQRAYIEPLIQSLTH